MYSMRCPSLSVLADFDDRKKSDVLKDSAKLAHGTQKLLLQKAVAEATAKEASADDKEDSIARMPNRKVIEAFDCACQEGLIQNLSQFISPRPVKPLSGDEKRSFVKWLHPLRHVERRRAVIENAVTGERRYEAGFTAANGVSSRRALPQTWVQSVFQPCSGCSAMQACVVHSLSIVGTFGRAKTKALSRTQASL